MNSVMITGVNGFVGKHLVNAAAKNKTKITGVGFSQDEPSGMLSGLLSNYIPLDLTDVKQVRAKIDLTNTDTVFHLAGLAAVGQSFEHPVKFITSNTAMLVNMAELALKQSSKARFIVASSGAVYSAGQKLPIVEDGALRPTSPYVISKITTELLSDYYRERGLDMIVTRPFNHIGPGQSLGFIVPDLALQASNYVGTGRFLVGNLTTKRDYTDVRDVVDAYIKLGLAKTLRHNTYNICSSTSFSGQDILTEICQSMGVTDPNIEVDQSKVRPTEIMDIRGDNSRLRKETSWKPVISLQQSIQDYIRSSS